MSQMATKATTTGGARLLARGAALALLFLTAAACQETIIPPTAVIDAPTQATTGTIVQVSGANSVAPLGGSLTFQWAFASQPAGSQADFNDPNLVNPSFLADVSGTYEIILVVTEGQLSSAPVRATIEASPCGEQVPTVDSMGTDPEFPATGDRVTLLATATDGDNSEECALGQRLSFEWTITDRPSGSTATLDDRRILSPTLLADVSGKYTVTLEVRDDTGLSSGPQELAFEVFDCGEAPPVINALRANPANPAAGQQVRLSSRWFDRDNEAGCDAGQTVSFQWQLTQRPVGSRTTLDEDTIPEPNLTPDIAGDYTVVLTLTDSTGRDSAPVELTFTAGECGSLDPQIDEIAVTPVSPNTGDDVELRIRVSDPDNDAALCGLNQALSVSSRFVQRPAGSAATLSPADGLRTSFSPDVPGAYVIRTTVSDDTGRSVSADTEVLASECGDATPAITGVTVTPDEPAVGQLVALDLETEDADNDPDGCGLSQALTVNSAFVSLPSGSSATLVPAIGTQPGFTPDVPGVYVVRSVIEDDTGRSSSFNSTVVVGECGSFAPTVTDVVITPEAPNTGDAIVLALTVEDRDNSTRDGGCSLNQVVTVSNSFIARPAGSEAVLIPATGPSPAFVADLPGDYVVRTVALDDTGLSTTTDTTIEVSDCGSASPTVTASSSPANPNTGDAVTLNIVVDDLDNDPAGCGLSQTIDVRSTFTGRPPGSSAVLSTNRGLAPGFIADIPGEYRIETVVTDETGRTGSTETIVSVSVCGASEPEVSSVVVSPANPNTGSIVTFFITATDPDNAGGGCALGQVVEVETVFTRRPAGSGAEISSAISLTPAFIADLPGEYAIRTTATDDTGRSSSRTTTVTVSECGATPPSVDSVVATPANPNTGDAVTFAIAVSDADNNVGCAQGQGLTTSSEFVARPAGSSALLSSRLGLSPAFVADIPGVYTIRTTVTDSTGRSSARETSVTAAACGAADPSIDNVTVNPASPNAGDAVALTIAVSDADNGGGACNLAQDLVVSSVFVARPAGSSASLSTSGGLTPSFISDEPGVYIVRSTVTDSTGRSASRETTISVSTCGAANPSVDAVVATPASPATGDEVTFAISVSDSDNGGGACNLGQRLTVTSTFTARPAGSGAALSTTEGLAPAFVADVPGAYTIHTVVRDDTGRSASRDTTVIVSTCGTAPPSIDNVSVAPASPNAGNEVTLTIDASDADNDPLGCGLSQSLSARSTFVARPVGSTATLSTNDGFAPSFVADRSGDYIVRTVVTDDTGASSFVDTPISVTTCGEAPPSVDAVAFAPAAPAVGSSVTFDITVSDADNAGGSCSRGQTLTVESTFVLLPAGSTATLSTSEGLNPSFVADASGDYAILTRVTDSTGRSSTATTVVTVSTCGESPPVVDSVTVTPAAPNSGDTVAIAIVASDADNGLACGLSQSVELSSAFIVRPAGSSAALSTTTGPDLEFEADLSGLYVVRVRATDSTGRSSFVDQPITVSGCGANAPSVASVSFSPDPAVVGSTVTLAATVADADNLVPCSLGQALTTEFALRGRPPGSSASLVGTQFITDLPGLYDVRVTVTDSTGLSGRRDTTISVGNCGAQSPTVDAVAVAPATPETGDSVTLTITASDLDNAGTCSLGQAINLSSEFIALPAGSTATLSTAAGATPSFVADVPGLYRVRSTATDSTGRSGFRDTVIVVDTCGSNAPTVDSLTVSVAGVPAPGDPAEVDTTDEVELAIVASDPDNVSCGASQAVTLSTRVIGQPAGTNVTISGATGPAPTFVVPEPGLYTVEVTATDSTGRTGTAQVQVLADVCGSRAPLASLELVSPAEAGPGASVTAPDVPTGSTLILDATSSTDPDDGCLAAAPPLTYSWRFVEVPGVPAPSFSDVNHAVPSFVAQRSGDYVVAVDVSDGFDTATATLTVNVNPAAGLGLAPGFSATWIDGSSGTTPHWSSPFGVAPGAAGAAFVAQSDSDSITRNTSPATVFATGGRLRRPLDILPFSGGFLVSNGGAGAAASLVLLSSGGVQSTFLASGGPIARPRGVASFPSDILAEDALVVADEDFGLVVLDTTGNHAGDVAFTPGCDLWGAAAVPLGTDDRLYATSPVCDAIFAADFTVMPGVVDHIARVPEPFDIVVHPTTGDLFVATRGGVMVVQDCGATDGSCPTGCLLDKIAFTRGVAFDDTGALLVTGGTPGDLFRIDGDFSTLFQVGGPDLAPYCVPDPYTAPQLTLASEGDVAEGDTAFFTITSSEIVFEDVVITLALSGTAEAPADYTAPSSTVTLVAGTNSVQVAIDTVDDDRYDALVDETLTVELIAANGAGAELVVGSDVATATIFDGETPPVLTLSPPAGPAVEGNTLTFTISATSEPFEDLTIGFDALGTATRGTDFERVGPLDTITFPEGSASLAVVFETFDDDLFDRAGGADETFDLELLGVSGSAATIGAPDTATGVIVDAQSAPEVSISAVTPTITEGSSAQLEVALSTANFEDLTVDFAYAGDAVAGGTDYSETASIVVPAGATSAALSLPVTQDFVYEPDETIDVTVDAVSGDGLVGAPPSASVTILADPQGPSVSVTTNAAPVIEGNGITFRFALDQIASRPVDVTYSLGGTATAGADYVTPTGTLTIPALTPFVDLVIAGLPDGFFDSAGGTESLVVTITDVVGADAVIDGDADTATATIQDDEAAPRVSIVGGPSVAEGGGNVVFDVTLDVPTFEAVSIPIAISGTATPGTDYTNPGTVVVTIPAGSTSDSRAYAALLDGVYDALGATPETVIATVGTPTGGAATRHPSTFSATIPITDVDFAPVVTVSGPASVNEGASATYTVSLTNPAFEAVSVTLAPTGSATSGVDFTPPAPLLATVPALANSVTFVVPALADSLYEGSTNEDMRWTISAPSGADSIRGATFSVDTDIIEQDDPPVVTIVSPGSVSEGLVAGLTVQLDVAATDDVTVDVAVGAPTNATLGDDYLAFPAQVVVPAGSTSAPLPIELLDDAIYDALSNETLTIDIVSVAGADAVTGAPDSATVTIVDAQGPPVVRIRDNTTPVSEGGVLLLRLQLSNAAFEPVVVDLSVAGGTATPGVDYLVPGPFEVTIPPGSAEIFLNLPTVADGVRDSASLNETVIIGIDSVSGAGASVSLTQDEGTGRIRDNEGAPVISLIAPAGTFTEGDTMVFTVQLSNPTFEDITLAFATGGTAVSTPACGTGPGNDYVAVPSPLTIDAGDASASLSFTLCNDNFFDHASGGSDSIIVTLGSILAGDATIDPGADEATKTFGDDDTPPAVSVTVTSPTTEGTDADFKLVLNRPSFANVDVNFTVGGSGDAGVDYAVPAQLTARIPAGANEVAIPVAVLDDGSFDCVVETVEVSVTSAIGAGVSLGTPSASTNIIDVQSAPTVSISGPATVDEGDAATYTFTLSGPTCEDVDVDYVIGGTASALDHDGVDGTATIADGDTTTTYVINTTDDLIYDSSLGNETIIVTLDGATGGGATINGAANEATTGIVDDETAPVVSLSAVTASVTEGTDLELELDISPASGEAIQVTFSAAGGTASPSDYTLPGSPINVPAGTSTLGIDIATIDDGIYESLSGSETFTFTITDASTDATVNPAADDEALTIVDAQSPPEVIITGPAAPIAEQTLGNAVFTFQLSVPTYENVVVTFSLAGTATGGSDYTTPVTLTRTVTAGATTANLSIAVLDDGSYDSTGGNETIEVTIGSVSGGSATVGSPDVDTAEIDDDEVAPVVTLTGPIGPVTEGTDLTFTAEMSPNPTFANVTVNLSYGTVGDLAASGVDYTAAPASITILAGDLSADADVTTIADLASEAAREDFTVSVSGVSGGGATLGSPSSAVGEILSPEPVNVVYLDRLLGESAELGSSGVAVLGDQSSGALGFGLVDAGDVNGDGFDDFLTGGINRPAVLLFGTAAGFPAEIDLAALLPSQGVELTGVVGETAVTGVGDFNGDGFDDFAVGTHQRTQGPNANAGAVYLVYGRASWAATFNLPIVGLNPAEGIEFPGQVANEGVGIALASADFNGDCLGDIAIAARGGDVHVVFGAPGLPSPFLLTTLAGPNGATFQTGSGLMRRRSLAGLGDVDGDGVADLLIGKPEYNPLALPSPPGVAFVVMGELAGYPSSPIDITAAPPIDVVEINGSASDDLAGWAVAGLGDVDGDRLADFVITAPNFDIISNEGAAFVFHGDPAILAGSPYDIGALGGAQVTIIEGAGGAEKLGFNAAGLDLDSDGLGDLIVGTSTNHWVFYGGPALAVGTTDATALDGANGFRTGGSTGPSDAQVSGADINGDGFDDALFGDSLASTSISSAGIVDVVFGGDFRGQYDVVGSAAGNTITLVAPERLVDGRAGNDTLTGNNEALNVLVGGRGGDTLAPGPTTGDTAFIGASGTDAVTFATAGNFRVVDLCEDDWQLTALGQRERFVGVENVEGSPLGDTLFGDHRANQLVGGDGVDILVGRAGDDQLIGGPDGDTLEGDEGADQLIGGSGDDDLLGGPGDDIILPEAGSDSMSGGSGIDSFVFTTAVIGTDLNTITDFDEPAGDQVNLVALLASLGGFPGAAAVDDWVILTVNPGDTTLAIDPDGTGPDVAEDFIVFQSVDLGTSASALVTDGTLLVGP
jgi:hypothetical protein